MTGMKLTEQTFVEYYGYKVDEYRLGIYPDISSNIAVVGLFIDYRYCLSLESFLRYSGIVPSDKNPMLISYYPNMEKLDKGIRQDIKPGKLFKQVFPWAKDSEVELFVKGYKAAFEEKEFDLIESRDVKDFKIAYTLPVLKGSSPSYYDLSGFDVKCLAASCMQKGFDKLADHPCTVYASGDFSIVYAIEKVTGDIAARCIIGHGTFRSQAQSIYTENNQATKLIADYMTGKGYETESDFDGLKINKVDAGYAGETYLMPYIDGHSRLTDCGDHFEIESGGNVECDNTKGYATVKEPEPDFEERYCESCDNYHPECDFYSVLDSENERQYVCDDCRRNNYVWSSFQSEYIHDSNVVSYYPTQYSQRIISNEYAEFKGYVMGEDGDFYDAEDCIEYEGEYYPTWHSHVIKTGNKLHHKDEKLGEYVRTETWSFQWVNMFDPDLHRSQATPTLVYSCEVKESLRDNFQLNDSDEPERIPELPGLIW